MWTFVDKNVSEQIPMASEGEKFYCGNAPEMEAFGGELGMLTK